MDRYEIEKHVETFRIDADERAAMVEALAQVPSSACMRAAFALPIPTLLEPMPALGVRYGVFSDGLGPVGGPFSWMPLTEFVLRWVFAGHLQFPDLAPKDAAARFMVTHISALKDIPTIQTLKATAGNDLLMFLRQGFQSLPLFQNFGVNDVDDFGEDWITAHLADTHWPAIRYVYEGYNEGIFALFEVDGEQTFFDTYASGFSVTLRWKR